MLVPVFFSLRGDLIEFTKTGSREIVGGIHVFNKDWPLRSFWVTIESSYELINTSYYIFQHCINVPSSK